MRDTFTVWVSVTRTDPDGRHHRHGAPARVGELVEQSDAEAVAEQLAERGDVLSRRRNRDRARAPQGGAARDVQAAELWDELGSIGEQ